MSSPAKGFTLIELLIVIAIILILIVIALPNFLEAQIRARVTKSRGEIRTYVTALESYFIDWRCYTRDHDSRVGTISDPHNGQIGFFQLTSPISYITDLPRDPFGENTDDPGHLARYYELGSGSDNYVRSNCKVRRSSGECGCGNPYPGIAVINYDYPKNNGGCVHAALVIGIGPDARDSSSGNDQFPYDESDQGPGPPVISFNSYSPTNGTKSIGDIYSMVGDYRNGFFFLDGQIVGHP